MKDGEHCEGCGAPLGNEKYWLPISVDEELLLCYECNLEEEAGLLIEEIEDNEGVLQVIRELQEEYDKENK